MKLTSTAFENEGNIPRKYTCDGDGISPPLSFSNIPSGTISFALIMDDPDVSTSVKEDGIWDHWVRFNIPATTTHIREGEQPAGTAGTGTGNNTQYQPPCPPDTQHHYYFNLYALDTLLDLPSGSTKKQVMDAMKGHILAKAILIGRYRKE